MPGVLGADKRISSSQGDGGREQGRIRMSIFVSSGSSSQPRLPARKQFNLFATVKIQRQQASFFQMEKGGGAGQEEEDGVGGWRGGGMREEGEGERKGLLTPQTFLCHRLNPSWPWGPQDCPCSHWGTCKSTPALVQPAPRSGRTWPLGVEIGSGLLGRG